MGAYTPVTDEDVAALAACRLMDAQTETTRCYELVGAAIHVKAGAYVKARIDGYSGVVELHDLCDFCEPFGIVMTVDRAERIFDEVVDRIAPACGGR